MPMQRKSLRKLLTPVFAAWYVIAAVAGITLHDIVRLPKEPPSPRHHVITLAGGSCDSADFWGSGPSRVPDRPIWKPGTHSGDSCPICHFQTQPRAAGDTFQIPTHFAGLWITPKPQAPFSCGQLVRFWYSRAPPYA